MLKRWRSLSLNHKIGVFIGTMFSVVLAAILVDVFSAHFFLLGFNDILENNAQGGNMILALESESAAFEKYIHDPSEDMLDVLKKSMADTRKAIYDIPMAYSVLGELRYAQIMAIRDSYESYCRKRNEILLGTDSNENYIDKLYAVYDMQDYLHTYAQRFITTTLEEGNRAYFERYPKVFVIPIAALFVFMILLVALSKISKMMKSSITEPVLNLASASRRIAANDFDTPDVVSDSEDELGDLVKAFNKMKYATGEYIRALEDRRDALDKLHAKEMEKLTVEKQLEVMNLEVLKNQINPHFLFNTLNVIGGMANLEDAKTTEEMISALSSFFRYNLKTHDTEVLLSKELKVASDYMYLQKMRFGSRVNYRVECEVEEDKIRVPAFMLQPLLENAVIHGLSPKAEGGEAVVKIRKDENENLYISVSDNGIGMTEDQLSELKKSLQDSSDMVAGELNKGIGVSNIYRRIQVMYADSSMEINSIYKEGTEILIRIRQNDVSEVK